MLIINADDFGMERNVSQRIVECFDKEMVNAVSAMVFMEDSERAAEIALEKGIDVGLHLNLTTSFTASNGRKDPRIMQYQTAIAKFLALSRFSGIFYHPLLKKQFEYVCKAQMQEFFRIYGKNADRIDGHRHGHVCMNVVLGKIIPPGLRVRRNFTFFPGEKKFWNRLYRQMVDSILKRRYTCTEIFCTLPKLNEQDKWRRILKVAEMKEVEVMVHPIRNWEYSLLRSAEFREMISDIPRGKFPKIF